MLLYLAESTGEPLCDVGAERVGDGSGFRIALNHSKRPWTALLRHAHITGTSTRALRYLDRPLTKASYPDARSQDSVFLTTHIFPHNSARSGKRFPFSNPTLYNNKKSYKGGNTMPFNKTIIGIVLSCSFVLSNQGLAEWKGSATAFWGPQELPTATITIISPSGLA